MGSGKKYGTGPKRGITPVTKKRRLRAPRIASHNDNPHNLETPEPGVHARNRKRLTRKVTKDNPNAHTLKASVETGALRYGGFNVEKDEDIDQDIETKVQKAFEAAAGVFMRTMERRGLIVEQKLFVDRKGTKGVLFTLFE